jgi:2-dehydropantoate 2-reductase
MRTALVGAGSVGTIVGAIITKKGGQIDLVDIYQAHVDALNAKGATIVGDYDFTVPVKAFMPAEMTGIYDMVFLLTKQTANAEILPALLPHLGPDSLVISLQNGIPEDDVARIVGPERTAGGAVGWGATFLEPGKSMLTSSAYAVENFAFDIGEIDGSDTSRIRKAQKLLSLVGTTHVLDNLMGVRWAKVLMNATFSGMSAAMGSTFGDVLNDDITIKCIAFIADETIRVANAAGYRMAPMQGKDFEELKLQSKDDIPGKLPFYHEVWDQHVKLKASMLQDLEKGRETEIDYINGYVAKKGREVGILTPFNDKVVEMVKKQEKTGVINSMAEKAAFLPLLDAAR